MDTPLQEASDGSLNHENTDNGSEHAGVGLSEQTGGKTSSQTVNARSGQTDPRTPEEASQLTEHRRTSQQAEHKSSVQADRRTSEPPNQQSPSLLEGKASEKIDDRVPLPSGGKASEKTDQGPLEYDEQTSPDQDDYKTSGKSQRQVYNQDDFLDEDDTDQHRFSEDNTQISHETEKQADHRSYYKTLAQAENRALSDIGDNQEIKEADVKVQPCKFEDSQTDIRSKVSTGEETESATAIQAYTLPDTEFTSNSQSSYEKLPSISSKGYYTSSQDKLQTTEVTIDTEFEQRKSSQRSSQTYRRRFPPIIFEDPYQVALCYMEKHNILQIFQQITENLVYEKPDDPLNFMLDQVQKMIRYRDQRRGI
ncbi:testis-specific expressed protein 55 [Alexandromys fortis]|uniref:testis-specific expressed protein 55 n=1 Tax=Alexandromys fortis TaxID=100897 RepID=UPI0021529A06|nr:testis-specific expressed protein 55 [Microtus fortis]